MQELFIQRSGKVLVHIVNPRSAWQPGLVLVVLITRHDYYHFSHLNRLDAVN